MAVYTVLERTQIAEFIQPFGVGKLVSMQGVADGIENTNYFISADRGSGGDENRTQKIQEYVLTLFEEIHPRDLDFYIQFISTLNDAGLPIPAPLRDRDGIARHTLEGKPATLTPKAAGRHPLKPTATQCHCIGNTLAKIHQVALDSGLEHLGSRNMEWLKESSEQLLPLLATEDKSLLLAELAHFEQQLAGHPDLPCAVIHGDIFRDNVLFDGEQLTAIIDFYSAGSGYLMYDLAIVVNDWCSRPDGSLDPELYDALLAGYQQSRSPTQDEQAMWNDFLRIAAVRFLVSRLTTQLLVDEVYRDGALVEQKDPAEYHQILLKRISTPCNQLSTCEK